MNLGELHLTAEPDEAFLKLPQLEASELRSFADVSNSYSVAAAKYVGQPDAARRDARRPGGDSSERVEPTVWLRLDD